MRFVQVMVVRTADPDGLKAMMSEWHDAEVGVAPGYQGSTLLASRDNPGEYAIRVEFSSLAEAEQNNDRPETQAWAARLNALISGEPEFRNFDEVHTVG